MLKVHLPNEQRYTSAKRVLNMGLRFLLVFLFLCVASAAVPQAAAPSANPQESAPAADFKEASRLLAAGSLDQATVLTKQGLTQSPHSLVGLNLLGVIYQQQGKYQEAVAQFQQALTINPNSVDALVNLGNSLAAQNTILCLKYISQMNSGTHQPNGC